MTVNSTHAKGGIPLPQIDWIDWAHLTEEMLLPLCILIGALIAGITVDKLINRRIKKHLKIEVELKNVRYKKNLV